MGLIIKTNRIWLPFLVMLLSASVTDRFIHPGKMPAGYGSQGGFRYVSSAAGLGDYHLYKSPDINMPAVRPAHEKTVTDDSVSGKAIWTRMRNGFVFPAVDPDLVRIQIDEYRKHPVLLRQILQRGEPYLFHILDRLEQENMPAELALLPVIESAFDPFAISPVGAAGLWQFMPETAAYVGLEQDWWRDGRLDIIASTDAALDYLGQLHKRFDNDWLLALAAYNAGGTRVRRAIRKNRDAGKPEDFWHLALPAETRSYVPKLIALRQIIENPDDYNISLPALSDTSYFSSVKIRKQIELRVAAEQAGITLASLQRLNPGYYRSITPPDTHNYILLPKSAVEVFRERISRLSPDQRVTSIKHRIREGDNLSTIAQQYGTTVSVLRRVNRLKGSKIFAGEFLIVPVGEKEDSIAGINYAGLM
jgi:membrane-bound lytic murein transglycosylase D